MTVCGKPGKRWCCFPPFPQTLEIDRSRFPHSHRHDDDEDELNPQKPGRLRDTHSEGKVIGRPQFSKRHFNRSRALGAFLMSGAFSAHS
jgi:hypothetical protein